MEEDASSSEEEDCVVVGSARTNSPVGRRNFGGWIPFAQAAGEALAKAISMGCMVYTWCE